MKMRNIAFMAEKIYTNDGFIIKYRKCVIMFNNAPYMGYDWYTSDNLNWIGIKRDKKSMSVNHEKNMNIIWRRIISLI